MNPTQANSKELLQQAIDAEIKSLEESIQVLKLRRNVLQPISSLPPEIFAAIFSLLCVPGNKPGIPSLGGKPSRRLRISRVCHQWREIALNQPQLWSHVSFNYISLAGATEILARAQSVPLYIEMGAYTGCDRMGLFLKEVRARLPHIRHLSIGGEFTRTIYQEIESALVSPAPILEYLSLAFEGYPESQVLDTLFGGSTPRLSSLKLSSCNISWNSPLFKGPTYLEILAPYRITRPTLAVWLDMLDEIPQLKMLTLHEASPVAAHKFTFDVERTVTLPSLTHLDILASLPDCAIAMAHLVLPALTSLCLTERHHEPKKTRRVQQFLPYVARHVHGPQDIRPLQSVYICDDGNVTNLLAWSVPDIDSLIHDPPAVLGAILPTRVKLSFRIKDNDQPEMFEMMFTALPLDGLLTLVVAVNVRRSLSQFWLRVLPNWPLLRRVRLSRRTSDEFIMVLLEDCNTPLLPSLTEIALVDTSLTDWSQLPDALMKRVEQGVPLETLDLRLCRSRRSERAEIRLLSEIVVNVLRPLASPLDALGREDPEDTGDEECRRAGREMRHKLVAHWDPFRWPHFGDDD